MSKDIVVMIDETNQLSDKKDKEKSGFSFWVYKKKKVMKCRNARHC